MTIIIITIIIMTMMIILAILKILISCPSANIDFPFSMQPIDDKLSLQHSLWKLSWKL